ncbi:uncharacterized protein LOC124807852 isoform X1 [Hydra vulgaris]|uniref:uncharacterized protein LOC124807852 isoform X1 n=1 Tax=Hydra vulgaris TaxID=6087 RepID=UPI0032EA08AF
MGKDTRSKYKVFLINDIIEILSSSQLPTGEQALQYLHGKLFKARKENLKYRLCDMVSCKFPHGSFEIGCNNPGGCNFLKSTCVVSSLKKIWKRSAIPIVADQHIRSKILCLEDRRKKLSKNKLRDTPHNLRKIDAYKLEIKCLFDISVNDAQQKILLNKQVTKKERNIDINFLNDQRGERKAVMGGIDKKYLFTTRRKQKGIEFTNKRMTTSNSNRLASKFITNLTLNQVRNSSVEAQNKEDNQDFEYQKDCKPRSHKRKPDFVEVMLPRKILKATAVTAKRYGIQSSAHTATLANVINSAGGNLKDFDISVTSAKVHSSAVISEYGLKVKEDFFVKAKGKLLCVHFDTKIVKEYFYGANINVERLALQKQLRKYWNLGISGDSVHSVCFDTTSSNTGWMQGACVLLEKWQGRPLLWFACRHHIYELHIKHVALAVSGNMSDGPVDNLFKKIQNFWETIKPDINLNNLNRFEWSKRKGTFLEEQALKTKIYLEYALFTEKFPRGDYKHLAELVLVWLGSDKLGNFKFRKPIAFHHARFLSKAIYYMTIERLTFHLQQFDIIREEEIATVPQIAEFIGLFHARWFLKAPLAVSSPSLDLCAIRDMTKYGSFKKTVSTTAIKSIKNHLWFLTERNVVFALCDETLDNNIREKIAKKLFLYPRPSNLTLGKPLFPNIDIKKIPELWQLVGPQSWILIQQLNLSVIETEWMQVSSKDWNNFSGYRVLKTFVEKLTVVNDCAERGVKLIQDFTHICQDEKLKQSLMISISNHRQKFSVNSKKNLSEIL